MSSTKIRLSVMMFLQYAIWGAWTTGLAAQLTKFGFSGGQIGSIFGCLWLACIIAPFIGGQIVDRFFPTQVFLGVAHLIGAGALYMTAIQTEFGPMWWWMLLFSLFYAPTLALTNSICFHNLADAERDFGRVRMWGTIGWIVAGVAVTVIRRVWHTEAWANGTDLFVIGAVVAFVQGLFCFALPHTPPTRQSKHPFAFLEALSLLKDKYFLVFMLVSFVVTTELQFYYVPTSVFLVDVGAREADVTLIKTVAQIAEILVLFFILHISIKKLGVRKTMAIGILAWPIRYFLFCIPNLPVIIASLTLHGFGYAFFFVASQIYVNMKSSDDMRASAQAMLTFFTLGLGNYLGTLFTGFIWAYFGGPSETRWVQFFMVPAGICIVMAAIFLIFFKDDVASEAPEAVEEAG